jgi:hypothetical protein
MQADFRITERSLTTTAHALMVRLVNGSFVPLSLAWRASGGLPLLLTNHNDMSYLVSLRSFNILSELADVITDNGPHGLVMTYPSLTSHRPTRCHATGTPFQEVDMAPCCRILSR